MNIYLDSNFANNFHIVNIQRDNPGPGRYGELQSIEAASTSFSKKGFGGFVSKVWTNR